MTLLYPSRRTVLAASAATLFAPRLFAATPINLGVLRLASHAPTFIAVERGYFAQEGLAVTLKYFEAAQPMAVAIASGDVDYGVTAMSGGLISLGGKGAIRIIGGALTEAPGCPGAIILASGKAFAAGVTTPAALKGHSFGITTTGSSFHYMAYRIARANGFATSDMILRPLQKLGAVVGALTSGQIDGWAVQGNIASKLQAAGARQIGRIADYAPDYQVTVVFSSTRAATTDRAKTAAFLRAFARAVDDYNAAVVDKTASKAEVAAVLAIVHKYLDPETPAETAATDFIDGAMRINKGLALNLASLKDQLEWFQSEKMVDTTITPDALFDTSYVTVL